MLLGFCRTPTRTSSLWQQLAVMNNNPNFPPNLDISPSISSTGDTEVFGSDAQANAIRTYGIAGRVWEAAYSLIMYLHEDYRHPLAFDPPFFAPDDFLCQLRILELGSGMGVIAAQIAKRLSGRRDLIIATDLPDVCSLLETNLQSRNLTHPPINAKPSVFVHPLAWGSADHARALYEGLLKSNLEYTYHNAYLTHIICSDLVYFPELFGPLLRTLIQLTSPPFADGERSPKLIISYRVRSLSKETPFWSAFGLWFAFEPVLCRPKTSARKQSAGANLNIDHKTFTLPDRSQGTQEAEAWHIYGDSHNNDGPAFVFVGHRQPESMNWAVPENDEDLLEGVGAWGTETRKSDDTFESVLLLNVGVEL